MKKSVSSFITVILLALFAHTLRAQRRIAVIVDTSGSMSQNDHSRFAVQISKILSDLVEEHDQIAIIRFPLSSGFSSPGGGKLLDMLRSAAQQAQGQNCDVGPDPNLMVKLDASQRESYKRRIDDLLQYDGPTVFGAPLRTAEQFLGKDRSMQRLLLLVSDAEEGFGGCKAQYTNLLQQVGDSGTTVALVKIGGYADDGFANNPAIKFRENVKDSANLIGAVAQVYQRFLGSKKVQTGHVSGDITVQIDPHVKEAYLVVAADSVLGVMRQAPGNPSAARVDVDFRSGGETKIVGATNAPDSIRGYRIVHLSDPAPGSYTFVPPPHAAGGWMLLQDYAIALRMITHTVPTEGNTPVQLEVIDERTNTRITDPATLKELRIDGKIETSIVSLTSTTPGVFTVDHQFTAPGSVPVQLRLRSGTLDRTFDESIEVLKDAPPPPPVSPPPPLPPPLVLMAKPGDIDYGTPAPLDLGRVPANGTAVSQIHFEGAHVLEGVDVEVSTDFQKRRAHLQILTPNGWQTLSSTPTPLRLTAGDPMRWPIRLQLEECPEGCSAGEFHTIVFSAHRTDGVDQRSAIPIHVEIVPPAWYVCWCRELFALLGALALGILFHGFVSPFAFARRIGVQLSPVVDLTEGYFYPLRAQSGSGSGFYRDATLFLTEDFRFVGRKSAGLVRLRAFRNQVRLLPENGRTVLQQEPDGSWEPLDPSKEIVARPGAIFRNESGTIYFDIRSG